MRFADVMENGLGSGGVQQIKPSLDAVRAQLDRLRTGAFTGSRKLSGFLRFVMDEALEGRGATLKELVIGHRLYDGVEDYDPRIDSTARVEARRLRRKLHTYYSGPGASDKVVVTMPTGSYAPLFYLHPEAALEPRTLRRSETPVGAASQPSLAVLPLTSLGTDEQAFAEGVTNEIIYAAGRNSGFRVAPRAVIFQYRGSRFSMPEVAQQTGSDLVLHGTIRRPRDFRRVSVEMTDRTGHVLWSDRMDVTGDCDLDVQERMAGGILRLLLVPCVMAQFAEPTQPTFAI